MTLNELTRRFPKASAAFIKANLSADSSADTIVERCPSHEPLAKEEVQRSTGASFLIRVTSVRKRLLDEDNLCEKYHVDLCRYAGVLPDDAPGTCRIETTQRKAAKGEAEHSVIEVYELCPIHLTNLPTRMNNEKNKTTNKQNQ